MEEQNSLTHHGVLGMKWGVRRYQNSDGSLNAKGKVKAKKRNLAKFVQLWIPLLRNLYIEKI